MPRATIKFDDHFKRFERDIDAGIDRGLRRAATSIRAAAAKQPTRYQIRGIMHDTSTTGVQQRGRFRSIFIYWNDFRAWWFEKGTERRLGAARSRRKHVEGNRGVKAGHYARKGLREVFPHVVELIKREIGRG